MENRSENSGQRTIHILVVMSALALFLAVINLSIPLDVYAVGELAFIGSPTPPIWYTPPPNGTPEPPLDIPHTVVLVKDFFPGNNYGGPSEFVEYNGELYFSAYGIDEYDNPLGIELFKYLSLIHI